MGILIIPTAILTVINFIVLYKERIKYSEDFNIPTLFGIFIASVLIAIGMMAFGLLMKPIYDKLVESGQTVFF